MHIRVEKTSIPGLSYQMLVSALAGTQLVTGVRDSFLPRVGITRGAHSKRVCRMQSFPLGGDCEVGCADCEAPTQAHTRGLPSYLGVCPPECPSLSMPTPRRSADDLQPRRTPPCSYLSRSEALTNCMAP